MMRKKILAMFLTLCMVVTLVAPCVMAEEADAALPKFKVVVSSELKDGTTTEVIGTVDADYNAKLVLPNADVNAGNVTIAVEMHDVESLGVDSSKSHSITLNTGVSSQGNLFGMLDTLEASALKDFTGAEINATIKSGTETAEVTYTLTGEAFSEDAGKVITATTDTDDARTAWHLMVNDDNFAITTQDSDDSYITIANGSWLQIGSEKLEFEDNYTDDLTVGQGGGLTADTVEDIKSAVKVTDTSDSALALVLKAGTTLAVGGSVATLKEDVTVEVSGVDVADLEVLSQLRDAANGTSDAKEIIIELIGLMNTAIELVDGETLDVTMTFGEVQEEPDNNGGNSGGGSSSGRTEITEPDVPLEENPLTFIDVAETDWSHDAVMYVYEKGLMSGVGNSKFAPETNTSRGMVATILHRLESTPAATVIEDFDDIVDGEWYADAAQWNVENEIMKGFGHGIFAPEQDVTREQLVVTLYRYAKFKGLDTTAQSDISSFADADEVSDWAKESMAWAVGTGLIKGRGHNNLAPAGTTTRAELATMLQRFLTANEL